MHTSSPTDRRQHSSVLHFDNGLRVVIRGRAVLGRAPQPTHDVRNIVTLPDLSRSVAYSHAVVVACEGGVLLEDLHSASGTWLINNGENPRALEPGLPIHVPFNTTAAFGSRRAKIQPLSARGSLTDTQLMTEQNLVRR
ncbi:FHA domain-containing protein [Kocuria sp.]|uniref:FHA domain-containing protein n=1 Tax=Kocuria sp. TaxID=1871328 RepID=UPI0034CE32A6